MSTLTEPMNQMLTIATAQAQGIGQSMVDNFGGTAFAAVAFVSLFASIAQVVLSSDTNIAEAAFKVVKTIITLALCFWMLQNWVGGHNLSATALEIKRFAANAVLSAPGSIGGSPDHLYQAVGDRLFTATQDLSSKLWDSIYGSSSSSSMSLTDIPNAVSIISDWAATKILCGLIWLALLLFLIVAVFTAGIPEVLFTVGVAFAPVAFCLYPVAKVFLQKWVGFMLSAIMTLPVVAFISAIAVAAIEGLVNTQGANLLGNTGMPGATASLSILMTLAILTFIFFQVPAIVTALWGGAATGNGMNEIGGAGAKAYEIGGSIKDAIFKPKK